jgi:S-adenosylmethionine-dependent methyltransferase
MINMTKMSNTNRSFDGITDKFAKNIYGTTKGQLRHQLLCHYLQQQQFFAAATADTRILDAGCGLGHMTKELAGTGASVTAIDISADSITQAQQLALPNVEWHVGDIHSVSASFDLITCHAVLEWVADPEAVIAHLLALLTPQGKLSLSFFNAEAHRFGNLVYGNFAYIEGQQHNTKTVKLNPQNPVSYQQVLNYLEARDDHQVIHQAGIRCVHDYMRDVDAQRTHFDDILEIEKKYGTQVPYLYLGKYFHVIIERR